MWLAVLTCSVAVALAGCTVGDDTTTQIRKLLATDRGPDDVLPAGSRSAGTSDPDSIRHIGDYDGVSYYVTEYVDPEGGLPGFCLVLAKPGNGAASGCASDRNATRMRVGSSGTGSARVVVPDDLIPEGWTKVGDFLIVNPDTDNASAD